MSGRIGIVNVETPEGLDARLKVQLPGRDLTGVEAALEIRDPNAPDAAIYSCRQTDSTITVQGDSIFVVIPPTTEGYELTTGYRYEHGLTIRLADGADFRLQGDWTVLRPAGKLAGRKTAVKQVVVNLSDAAVVVDLTVGPQGPAGGSGSGGGYLELEFAAADISAGLPLLIGSVPVDTLVCIAVLRFATYFDQNVVLKVGQEGSQKEVFGNDDPPDEEGYETRFYSKFSGDIFLYPEFVSAPAIGAGVVYLTRG
jgi:hypothetical protein